LGKEAYWVNCRSPATLVVVALGVIFVGCKISILFISSRRIGTSNGNTVGLVDGYAVDWRHTRSKEHLQFSAMDV